MSLIVKTEGEVGTLRLNLPAEGNKLSQAVVIEIAGHLADFARNETIKTLVISGEGEHFCMGRAPGPKPENPTPMALRSGMMGPIVDVYRAMRAIQVPIVALVQGEANGFGAALAGSADITIAAQNARFSFPEMKSDMPPTLAMATVMDRVAPKALAFMVYTTKAIDAAQAQQIGLVSQVVPLADLTRAGTETVDALLARKRDALRGVKQYLAQSRFSNFEQAADYGSNLLAVTLASQR
jgi:enoyl-CoA hydratase